VRTNFQGTTQCF
jgi:hypothetical protein